MNIDVSKDNNELGRKVADWLVDYVKEVLKDSDRFTIALSGGNTPKNLYTLLAKSPYAENILWQKIHFFWGDERYVPYTDEKNNARMAYDTLLDHVNIRKENVHVMRTDLAPEASANAYEKKLKEYFDTTTHSFDLVLLGMGDDAHTLSLFPGHNKIHEKDKWVISFYLDKQQMHRITLTAPVVNRSKRVAFLVTGADKAEPLYHVLYGMHDPDLYPAQLIQPFNGETYWFVDTAAASELQL